ncbi:hypothetical protein Deba_2968 [Desulfarculus baarsii DSM 2075]|uniref:Uncharacterized protein n=1 Tax=Desulfarculus baarsii (strain ATCC 33931 / DSM 2075 / LMG 7858 / VKM B-1802 / 2st14) TaxID=644282 RepID=E1QKW2_DESB2|nr:hypothetical protein [Desulfarculus baarsii]ADK86321.1 hypothetical protein Deba_2968 [Desulfarculus baarsii DSM 2075]
MEGLMQDFTRQSILALLLVIPAWKVCQKAGFDPKWGLLVFVPYLGYLALSLKLALSPWPAASGRGGR